MGPALPNPSVGSYVTFFIGEHAGFGVVETIGDHFIYVRLPDTFPNGLPVFEAVRPDEIHTVFNNDEVI